MHNHLRDHAMHAATQLMRRVGISLKGWIYIIAPPIQPKIRKINMEKYKIRSQARMAYFPG